MNTTQLINGKGRGCIMNGQSNLDSETESDNLESVKSEPYDIQTKYIFNQKFTNECDAFINYFQAIKNNGVMLNIMQEIENMGDYCDLFNDVNKDFYNSSLNAYSEPIPAEEQNESMLYASNLIRLIDTPEKGRCLVANTVIPKNKVLILEPPVVLQVKPLCTCVGDRESSLYRCHNCGIACKMFFTCEGCNVCIFCSRMCMLFAYENYHRYECYGVQRHFWSMEDTDYSYLSLRMMLYGASKKFKTNPIVGQPYGNAENNYPFISMLEYNFTELPRVKINEILYSSARNLLYLIMKTNFFNLYNDKKVDREEMYLYVGGLLVKHYCQAQINNIILKYPNLPASYGIDVISGTGKAICPTIALLNHSCSPNATLMVYYDSIAVKSVKTIKPGEEVTICYSEVDALMTLSERQTITEELFFFTCKCYFCEYERHWAEAPYKCLMCGIGKAKNVEVENKSVGYCTRCQKYFSLSSLADNLKVARICQNLYKATYAIEHVTRLAECYGQVFPPNSWNLLDVYKLLYEKHVLGEEKPLEAIKYGLLSFNILEHYVSRLYLPLLIAKVKFVVGVLNMRNFPKIKNVSEPEFDTMRIFVSEIIKMKEDLEFYLPEQRILFHQEIMIKVHEAFKAMQLN
ncbi:hypothetical protein NQ315_015578 [Exocentrus adspersus]|uniref:SET domain-containing protein n=1 Tax=Exocentrus adspersus TaxID=1586481 RepID=A0AAV8V9D1_9CUCU|nr:hypothetical protein NQ315_015578 [Exocentrus adspersus]